MRQLFNYLAAILVVTAATWWWSAGAHQGWTKTSVQVWKYDEITEISYPETVRRFVPGIDLLVVCVGVSVLLVGAGHVAGRRKVRP